MATKFERDKEALHSSGAVNLVVRGGRVSGVFEARKQVPGTPRPTNPFHYAVDITHDGDSRAPLLAVESLPVLYSVKGSDGALELFLGTHDKRGLNGWRYVHNSVNLATVGHNAWQGQAIARMGATGNVNGAHVHLERYVNGVRVDPVPYLLAMVEAKPSPILESEDMFFVQTVKTEGGRVSVVIPGKGMAWVNPQELGYLKRMDKAAKEGRTEMFYQAEIDMIAAVFKRLS